MKRPAVASPLAPVLARLDRAVARTDFRPAKGRVVSATGTILRAVVGGVRVGELCLLRDPARAWSLRAEVVGIDGGDVLLTPIGSLRGLVAGAEVLPTGEMIDAPVGPALLGRVLDGTGEPVDGRGPLPFGTPRRPLHAAPPEPMSRAVIDRPMPLGLRALDAMLTCGEGQRIGIFGEAGAGKSTLVSQIVRGAEADVAVVALVGERGREVREFIEQSLGQEGLARSVVVAATSDRPPAERIAAALVATTIAEAFRDEGLRVLLFVDSVTRYARALREIGLAAGEPPTRRGFPPSVFAALPALMERAGPAARGSITAFFAVLVEGEDGVGDPIAEETRSILDGHVVLSAKLAAASHFPAIDVLASRSRVMRQVTGEAHQAAAAQLRRLLARHQEVEFLLSVGEYKAGVDPLTDAAVQKMGDIRAFLQQGPSERTAFDESLQWLQRITR